MDAEREIVADAAALVAGQVADEVRKTVQNAVEATVEGVLRQRLAAAPNVDREAARQALADLWAAKPAVEPATTADPVEWLRRYKPVFLAHFNATFDQTLAELIENGDQGYAPVDMAPEVAGQADGDGAAVAPFSAMMIRRAREIGAGGGRR